MQSFRILVFNKPMGVLTRFTDPAGRPTLGDFIAVPGVYPVGRLDRDSEGLLVLTDRATLVEPLLRPGGKRKTYLACVEGEPDEAQLEALRRGPRLKEGPSLPVEVERLPGEPDWLWPRNPPIRFRKTVPVTWLQLVLREGRNRQVRRMTAAVGLPTLRLVRIGFGPFRLSPELHPGCWREATGEEKGELLRLEGGRRPRPRGKGSCRRRS